MKQCLFYYFFSFMASVHFDMLVPCGDMDQVREVLHMDKKIMNTVLGCFSDHGSECKYCIALIYFKPGFRFISIFPSILQLLLQNMDKHLNKVKHRLEMG